MPSHPNKNESKLASRSSKDVTVRRQNIRSDSDVRDKKEVERLTKNRDHGAYLDGGIGIVPISILT
jgi:hypothetical protein